MLPTVTTPLSAKKQIKANIGQSLVNTSEVLVNGTKMVADFMLLGSDLTSYIRRELRDEDELPQIVPPSAKKSKQ